MSVRFRQSRRRLQCSLIETRRVDGKVRREHVAGLGAVPIEPSIAARRILGGGLSKPITRQNFERTLHDAAEEERRSQCRAFGRPARRIGASRH
jgi:hypothetical protein